MTYAADPRVDAYIDALPDWQQAICRQVRDLVHAADPEVTETSMTPRRSSTTRSPQVPPPPPPRQTNTAGGLPGSQTHSAINGKSGAPSAPGRHPTLTTTGNWHRPAQAAVPSARRSLRFSAHHRWRRERLDRRADRRHCALRQWRGRITDRDALIERRRARSIAEYWRRTGETAGPTAARRSFMLVADGAVTTAVPFVEPGEGRSAGEQRAGEVREARGGRASGACRRSGRRSGGRA
jgi:hypothetical protein